MTGADDLAGDRDLGGDDRLLRLAGRDAPGGLGRDVHAMLGLFLQRWFGERES